MANYLTDRVQEYGAEERRQMLHRVEIFYKHYEGWDKVRQAEIPVFEQMFRERLDKAFGYLQTMTVEILGCTDEELNAVTLAPHARLVVATVRVTREAFGFLCSTVDNTLSTLCTQAGSQGLFAQQTDLEKLEDDLQKLIHQRISEVDDVEKERPTQWSLFTEAQATFEEYERKIRDYDDLNYFEQLLTSKAHDQYEGAKNDAEQRRNAFKWEHTRLCELNEWLNHQLVELKEAQTRVTRYSDEALGVEDRVVNAKEAATELYGKACELDNYLTTRDIEFRVEEVMRHILQFLYTSVVDSDVRVKGSMVLILDEVVKKYGVEKTEELKQSKKYLV